jgi:hypothetical protein
MMEFKVCHEFSIKKGDNVYTLHIPPNASIGELLDVSFQILEEAKRLAVEQAKKAAPQELPVDQTQDN